MVLCGEPTNPWLRLPLNEHDIYVATKIMQQSWKELICATTRWRVQVMFEMILGGLYEIIDQDVVPFSIKGY